uniref:CUB domain-containing protein n=1 Tax=Timema cristinae TaxID=61476 RepID=A0A7R9GUZ2_TIMCR|nr:unnamed protein product [Timema cristinae]
MLSLNSASHGILQSPGSPGKYPNNRDCYWKLIHANYNKRIQFHFFTLMIESHPNCSFDYLEILDGWTTDSPLLNKYCNSSHPAPLTTPGPAAMVHFHSDEFGNDAGFQISYTLIEGILGCGGVLTGPSGSFSSPNHPDTYRENMECEWKIQLPVGERIQLTFMAFSLEDSTSCKFDYVEINQNIVLRKPSIQKRQEGGGRECRMDKKDRGARRGNVRDGDNINSPLIGRYCGSQLPPIAMSTSNNLVVKFRSDWSYSAEGFRISFQSICGGLFSDLTGTIHSPYYPRSYPTNKICIYHIALPPGKAIQLTFQDFDVEDTLYPTCPYDHVQVWKLQYDCTISPKPARADMSVEYRRPSRAGRLIRDGDTENSTLIGTYCGEDNDMVPPPVLSTHNYLWIKFKTDSSVENKGFLANYSSVDICKHCTRKLFMCGGIYKSSSGTIQTPAHPEVYPPGTECQWVISTSPGKVIQLTFMTFNLEGSYYSTGCPFDSVTVYDNSSDPNTGGLMGRILYAFECLKKTLSGSYDIDAKKRLYKLVFCLLAVCGGSYFSPTGMIRSPNYPNGYPRSKNCVWTITAPPGQQIMLNVTDFKLESHHMCSYDYLEINRRIYLILIIIIIIIIIVNCYQQKSSISLYYHFSSLMVDSRSPILSCSSSYGVVHGTRALTDEYPVSHAFLPHTLQQRRSKPEVLIGQASAPKPPTPVRNHMCKPQVRLTAAGNGGYENSPLLGKFCGTTITKIMRSYSNQIYIHFVSDSSNSLKGFSIHWDATSTGCGGTLASSSGSIISPNYPQPYNHKAECLWKIIVSRGSAIQLVFVDLDLESQSSCLYDYVEVRDGIDSSAKRIGRYCTTGSHPLIIRSTSNHLFINFHSDVSRSGRGFHIKFDTVCNNIVRGYRGVIESPNFPENYPGDVDCTWNITATQGNKLNLTFSHFELEDSNYYMTDSSNHCNYDYVEVKAGSGSDPPTQVLGKFCGQDIPAPISSATDHIYVHFVTDSFTTYSGFRIEWVLNGCGDHFEHPQGVFTTPNYPNGYPSSTTCEWLITVDWGKSVEVTIDNFDLEGTVANCHYDALRVSETLYMTMIERNNIVCVCVGLNSQAIIVVKYGYSKSGVPRGLSNLMERKPSQVQVRDRRLVRVKTNKLGTGSGQLAPSLEQGLASWLAVRGLVMMR